mgnify:CR=1 FL=1
MIKRQIARLEGPAVKCVEAVFEELVRLLSFPDRLELKRYPVLTMRMVRVAEALVKERLEPTLAMVRDLVAIEQAYINTGHPDFLTNSSQSGLFKILEGRKREELHKHLSSSDSASIEPPINPNAGLPGADSNKEGGIFSYLFKTNPNTQQANQLTQLPTPGPSPKSIPEPPSLNDEKEEFETRLILSLMHSYFAIVKRNLMDTVPKACMHLLVNKVVEELPSRLVSELYKEELFDGLLKEDETITRQREQCWRDLHALQEAASLLSELKDV